MNLRLLSAAALAAVMVAPATAAVTAAEAAVSAAPKPLAGVAVYLSTGEGHAINRFEPGKGFTKLGAMPATGQFSVSPDGRKVAYVTGGGDVRVRSGRTVRTVAKGAAAGAPCLTPVWSPDSTRVAFLAEGQGEAQRVVVAGVDGSSRRIAGSTRGVCHLAWSGDGRYLAGHAGTTEGVYRFDLRTGTSVRAKGIGLSNHVQSLSPDGAMVVFAPLSRTAPAGDGSWPERFRPAVVDVTTGRKVSIPVKGTLIGAVYLPDGRLVVRVAGRTANTLVVLDRKGRQLQRLPEPAAVKNSGLLQVVR